jgi:crossover junction endodeoxyribonuclease RuvC
MRILGLDLGSQATGYGIVESSRVGSLRALRYGTLVPPRKLDLLARLPHIAHAVELVLQAERPDSVAVEDIFLARNTRVALQLGQVRGAALVPVLKAGLEIHAYAPRLVKKAVVGYGAAEKEQVRRMVCLLLGLRDAPPSLDASDALAVAICHAHAHGTARFVRDAARA